MGGDEVTATAVANANHERAKGGERARDARANESKEKEGKSW